MPRKSAEQRSAELFRTGNKPPQPPVDLSPPAAELWKAIATSKPADYWTPALQILLRAFCETSEHSQRVATRLAALPVGDPEALALGRQMAATNASLGGLSQKMRLSAQSTVSLHATAQLAERGIPQHLLDDPYTAPRWLRGDLVLPGKQ
jgi:hypothetical protein